MKYFSENSEINSMKGVCRVRVEPLYLLANLMGWDDFNVKVAAQTGRYCKQDGNTLVFYACDNAVQSILHGALEIGSSPDEFDIFIDNFHKHRLTNFGENGYRINQTLQIDLDGFIYRIQSLSRLLSEPLRHFFLKSVVLDVESENQGWTESRMRFMKDPRIVQMLEQIGSMEVPQISHQEIEQSDDNKAGSQLEPNPDITIDPEILYQWIRESDLSGIQTCIVLRLLDIEICSFEEVALKCGFSGVSTFRKKYHALSDNEKIVRHNRDYKKNLRAVKSFLACQQHPAFEHAKGNLTVLLSRCNVSL